MNFELIFLEQVESTNSYLQDLLKKESVEEGQWVQAAFQTAGRGQRSKEWFGESGLNFYGSLLLKPKFLKVEQQFKLNLFVSLALREAIQHFCSNEIQIKWPNDLLIGSKKISGILIENSIAGNGIESSVIGIGVNINQLDFPESKITSILAQTGINTPVEVFFSKLKESIEEYYLRLSRGDELLPEYLENLFGYKEEIELLENNKTLTGKISGLDESGCLLFEENNGRKHRFCSGQITFLL